MGWGLGKARSLEQMSISVKTLIDWKSDINWAYRPGTVWVVR